MVSADNTQILSAVFVDYDNVYLSLRRQSEEVARRFAKDPKIWLRHIESGGLITPSDPSSDFAKARRRVVMARCYGNPVPRPNPRTDSPDTSGFPFVRLHFMHAGFEIVDCPPLTTRLKNSSDIRMVMDIRDVLAQNVMYDEFIILSGDADFTPLLHRLRAHARRTVIYASAQTAPAYAAVCDAVITEQSLLKLLNDGTLPESVPRTPEAYRSLDEERAVRAEIIAEIAAAIDEANAPVPLETLADRAQRALGHDRTVGTGWGGYGQFRSFLIDNLPEHIELTQEPPYRAYDPARHALDTDGAATEAGRTPQAAELDADDKPADRAQHPAAADTPPPWQVPWPDPADHTHADGQATPARTQERAVQDPPARPTASQDRPQPSRSVEAGAGAGAGNAEQHGSDARQAVAPVASKPLHKGIADAISALAARVSGTPSDDMPPARPSTQRGPETAPETHAQQQQAPRGALPQWGAPSGADVAGATPGAQPAAPARVQDTPTFDAFVNSMAGDAEDDRAHMMPAEPERATPSWTHPAAPAQPAPAQQPAAAALTQSLPELPQWSLPEEPAHRAQATAPSAHAPHAASNHAQPQDEAQDRAPSAPATSHGAPATPGGPTTSEAQIASIRRIYEACQAPILNPTQYRTVFVQIATEIAENGFSGSKTVRNTTERLVNQGINLRQEDVRFIVEVVTEADPWFEHGASANLFAGRFRNFVVARCRSHGLLLSADEIDLIDAWFAGAPLPADEPAPVRPGAAGARVAAPDRRQPAHAAAPAARPTQPAQHAMSQHAMAQHGGAQGLGPNGPTRQPPLKPSHGPSHGASVAPSPAPRHDTPMSPGGHQQQHYAAHPAAPSRAQAEATGAAFAPAGSAPVHDGRGAPLPTGPAAAPPQSAPMTARTQAHAIAAHAATQQGQYGVAGAPAPQMHHQPSMQPHPHDGRGNPERAHGSVPSRSPEPTDDIGLMPRILRSRAAG